MSSPRKRRRAGRRAAGAARRGSALLLTLFFLGIFASLAVAIAVSSESSLVISTNRLNANRAGALAEAGLRLAQLELGGVSVTGATPLALHEEIATHLQTVWADSSMCDAQEITFSEDGVDMPPIEVAQAGGESGTIEVTLASDGGVEDSPTITVTSTGRYGTAVRTVSYALTTQGGASIFSVAGIVSKSPISMTGNPRIYGANNDVEGSVLSATYSVEEAVTLTGNCTISGNVGVCNPSGTIRKTGNVHVWGEETIGVAEPAWPEIDTGIFEQYVETTLSGSTSGNKTFKNIRVPAGTNPTFNGNVDLFGVIYIESPNRVKFNGNTTLCGVIVAEPPTVPNLSTHKVEFKGNMNVSGVENLPDEDRYDGLRDQTGTFLLAPGYAAKFTGNFSTISGCMVASQFEFTGNAHGTVRGGVLNLEDTEFEMRGNAELTIDLENADPDPAGIGGTSQIVCVSGSYED